MSDLGGFSLHELFRGEAETHAAALSEGLVRLEGASDPRVVEPLMRAAHSIKGAARVIGLDVAVKLAHAMEDVLVAMQKGREAIVPARIDQLLKGTDLLASLARVGEAEVPAWTASNEPAVDLLVAELRAAPPAGAAPVAPATVPETATPPATPAEVPAAAARSEAVQSEAVQSEVAPASPVVAPAVQPPAPVAAARATSVRVTAEKLDRLLQLAGESMLEARRLSGIRDEALALKRIVTDIEDELDLLRANLRKSGGDPSVVNRLRVLAERSRVGVLSQLLSIESAIRRDEETSGALYHEVLSSRMRPFSDATGGLPRTVRDLSRSLGKDVRLEIAGEHV
ncbi:MAG: Gliding motility regulatory protein, partial [Planctomycetota bacterium]